MYEVYARDICNRFIDENDRIKKLVIDKFIDIPDWPLYEISEYAIFRLQDNTSCFIRDLTLALSTSKVIGTSGAVYTPMLANKYDAYGNIIVNTNLDPIKIRVKNRKEAMDYLRNTWDRNKALAESARTGQPVQVEPKPSYWEPTWFDKKHLKKVSNQLSQNQSPILSAMSVIKNPIPEMRPIRNYIAHRNPNTGAEFRMEYGIWNGKGRRQPAILLFGRVVNAQGISVSKLENWIERLNDIAKRSCV